MAGSNYVAYNIAQARSDSEKARARNNIGAAALASLAALQEQVDDIDVAAVSGYTPKGPASVATLNGLTGQENGWLYTMTDAGTLTDGNVSVVAGDEVAWDATNSVWYKAMNYAPAQYGTNEVHNLTTSITAFRTGDMILVDGPSGTAKMSKDDLLRVTAQNAHIHVEDLADFIFETPLNIFEKSQTRRGYLEGNSGVFHSSSLYRITEKVLLFPHTSYTIPFSTGALGNNLRVYLCDIVGSITGCIIGEYSDGKLTFISPDYFTYAIMNMGTYSDSQFMVCKTADYPESHVDYSGYNIKLQVNTDKLKGDVELENLGNVLDVSPNLFNPDYSKFIQNEYISGDGYSSGNRYYISSPVYLKGGITYKSTRNHGALGSNYKYAIVDVDGELLSTASGSNDSGNTDYLVFTLSSDCYVRLNLGTGDSAEAVASNFIISEYDKFPNSYIPYGNKLKNNIVFNSSQFEEIKSICDGGELFGKILSVNGDSICYGEGFAGGYGKIIADMFGMTFENRGVSGATISAGTTYSGGGNRHWICRDIENMRSDADYVLLEGGVNDSAPEIGSITDGYTATLDDTTFAGAMEEMVRDALTRFAGKKIGYIAVHKMTTGYDSRGDENNRYWISKRVCEKWGMPFLDLNVSCPAFGFYNSYTTIGAALREVYTKNGDGWHPNEDGYKKYYVDKIIEFMKSL